MGWTSAITVTLPDWSSQNEGTYTVQATATDTVGNAFAGTAVFFCALPLVLYIMKERRGISWRGLLQQILRLPFSD